MSIPAILYNIAICNLVPVILFIISCIKAKEGKPYRGVFIAGITVGVLWLLPQILLHYSFKGYAQNDYLLYDAAFFILAIILTRFLIYIICENNLDKIIVSNTTNIETIKPNHTKQVSQKKFICMNCGNYSNEWSRKCFKCGAEGQMFTLHYAASINPSFLELHPIETQDNKEERKGVDTPIHFCRKCGAEQLPEAVFCRKCGYRIIKSESSPSLSPEINMIASSNAEDCALNRNTLLGDSTDSQEAEREPSDNSNQEDTIPKTETATERSEEKTDSIEISEEKADIQHKSLSLQSDSSLKNQLRELKSLLDEDLITEEEYNAKKKQLLGL